MDILKFRVRGQALTLINPNVNLTPVTDTVNQYLCQFEFSEDWDDLNKVVVFKNVSYNISKEVYLSTSNECYIPWEVLSNSGDIFLEVIGTEVRGEVVTVRIPSTLLGFKWQIQEGLLDVSANVSPTPDLFGQFISSVREDSIAAITARDEAVIARDAAVQSAADASASELAATSAAESAVNSASTASSAASSASESALSVAGVADETKSYAEIASAKAADASTQAEIASGAKEDAVIAKDGAEAARNEAATSANLAQTTESHIKTMTVSAHSLAETEAPTVTKTDTSTGFALDFGIPKGAKGEDGDNIHYTWVKYADTPTSGMSDNPTGKAYIGIAYNKSTPVGSTVYSDYAWSRIKGEVGEDGYSPTVTTGTSSDGSTTLTVTNKDGSTTTTLHDGKARTDAEAAQTAANNAMAEISATATDLNAQKSRIDQFTALAEGSTTGDAELMDIRVGADGTTYDTAGNAVRGQISGLKSDLIDISDTTKNLWSKGDISFIRNKAVDFSLSAGTYTFSAVCTTNDTDSEYGVIFIRNGTNNLASFIFLRNSRQSAKFSISSEADNVLFFASDTDVHSVGDTATYKDIQIEVGEKQTEYVSHFIAKDIKSREDISIQSERIDVLNATVDRINSELSIKIANVTNVLDGDFSIGTQKWTYGNGSATVSDKTLAIVGDGNGNYIRGAYYSEINISDNPYFACAKVRVKDENCDSIIIKIAGGYEHTKITKPIKDKWYTLACLYGGKQTGSTTSFFSISANYADNTTQNGKTLEIKECIGVYLKDAFGLGYSPKMFELLNMVKYNGYWNGTKSLIIKKEELKSYLKKQQTAFSSKRKPLLTIVDDDGWQRMYDEFLPISERYNVPFVSSIQINSTVNDWNALFAQNEMNWELAVHPDCLQTGGLATLKTESEIEQWMIDTNKYLDEHGYKWTNCVYANGEPDERVRRIAKKYYKCGAVGSNPMVNKGVVPMFEIQRIPVGYPMGAEWNTFEHLKTYIDEAIRDNGWCVLMTHAGMTDWHTSETTEIIRRLIEYALNNGVEVVTLEKGLEIFGNALEVGDYIGTAEQGFAISYDGQFSRNPFATT